MTRYLSDSTRGVLLLPLMTAALALPAAAQVPQPMTIRDLIEIPSVGDPQLSPDGRQVLWGKTVRTSRS